MRKLKICQISLGGPIEIPPKNWGAIEKVVWNYKVQLEKMGHTVDIKLPWEIKDENGNLMYDIIHTHAANQSILDMVQYQKVPYVFSMHDHHTYRYGKDSNLFKENLEAIKKSVISYTFSEFFVNYFEETDKLFFLPHGVDNEIYRCYNNQHTEHKLLCVANNGYADNPQYDRKGFRYAIEAARNLDIPITIVGPRNNDNFLNANKDLLEYNKLTVIYEPNEKELVDIYNDHTIFLHPSELEAGHPNLTLLEALACGLPIVGTYDGVEELGGLIRCKRDTSDVTDKIIDILKNYEDYKFAALETAKKYDWSNVVKILENSYQNVLDIKEEYTHNKFKNKLIDIYNNTKFNKVEPKEPKVEIRYNFNDGAFLEILSPKSKMFEVNFIDKDVNSSLYSVRMPNNSWAKTNIKYFKNWRIHLKDENGREQEMDLDLKGKNVMISLDSSSLGDTLAWFPYAEEFRKKYECKMYCLTFHNYFFEQEYPEITFITPGSEHPMMYAMYKIGWFSPPWGGPRDQNPMDYRTIPLQKTATDILGLPYKEVIPKITIPDKKRPIEEKYICIAEYSTANAKHWNRVGGWQSLVDYFKSIGYKVMVISEQGTLLRNTIIQTGKQSMMTRINQLQHCEFFVGVGSGLSWVAWAVGKPVVMISGFSKPYCEFTSNCVRIHNDTVCNGCFNDIRFEFNKGDLNWCPEWKDTPRMFECTKTITPEYVIEEIKKAGLI